MNNTNPTTARLSFLSQICNLILGHPFSKPARKHNSWTDARSLPYGSYYVVSLIDLKRSAIGSVVGILRAPGRGQWKPPATRLVTLAARFGARRSAQDG